MRILLSDGLSAKGTPGTWGHIKKQIGMFSFTGLTVAQSERMINKHHVYMLKNGRISMAGLNKHNIQYVIDAMDECVRNA
ncbi:aspartate aminotransferase, putative [Perkinsus marinus ATCC 50983]|nr:aspartate aminotransferase, putative [Perkinsus marinus ATCC 50983]EEQ99978.1 aspartate aminotransferase, putative [Perkinsus marinus ATCC 50983]|eukprot:XP_002767261.1 aspartate aminotransferase, putative [Perkinsus marinus ATCC 50983]